MSNKDDDLLLHLERESERGTQSVRQVLLERGRPDLLKEFDSRMKDIRLGLYSARNCWHSISVAQRRVLINMRDRGGGVWRDQTGRPRFYHRINNNMILHYRTPTIHKLIAHNLLAWDANEGHDKAILTERGQFVLKHGTPFAE